MWRGNEMREKRENAKYAVFPLMHYVPQSLIISWRKDLDRGITRGINTADFPLSPVLHYMEHPGCFICLIHSYQNSYYCHLVPIRRPLLTVKWRVNRLIDRGIRPCSDQHCIRKQHPFQWECCFGTRGFPKQRAPMKQHKTILRKKLNLTVLLPHYGIIQRRTVIANQIHSDAHWLVIFSTVYLVIVK